MDIEVILPNGKKEIGDVDPAASLEEIKEDIVKAYAKTIGASDPNKFYLLIGARSKSKLVSLEDFNLLADAMLYLIPTEKFRGNAFTPKQTKEG